MMESVLLMQGLPTSKVLHIVLFPVAQGVKGQVENAEVRKPKYGNGSTETEVRNGSTETEVRK